MGVHGPNNYIKNKDFFQNTISPLIQEYKQFGKVIMMGDMNIYMSKKDNLNSHKPKSKHLKTLAKNYNLANSYQLINKNKHDFTWFKFTLTGNQATHINMILTYKEIPVLNSSIVNSGFPSNHNPVITDITWKPRKEAPHRNHAPRIKTKWTSKEAESFNSNLATTIKDQEDIQTTITQLAPRLNPTKKLPFPKPAISIKQKLYKLNKILKRMITNKPFLPKHTTYLSASYGYLPYKESKQRQ